MTKPVGTAQFRLRASDEDAWTDYDLGLVPSQRFYAVGGSRTAHVESRGYHLVANAPTAPDPGADPVRIRMMGGTVPTDVLVAALPVPFVLVPTVNADNNQHARDENLRVGNLVTGVETLYSLLVTPFPAAE